MTTKQERIESIRVDYEARAKAMKEEGWKIVDSPDSDTLWVEDTNDENAYYAFKYDEREELLNSKPDWLEMDVHDFILAIAVSW